MELAELRGHRVGVLMSGGLSCTAVGLWLAEHGVDTVSFVADLGQLTPCPADELAEVLGRHGLPTTVVDLRAEIAETCLDLVRHQATHDGGYWNTTSVSRATLVAGLAEPLRKAGCTVLVHGCVGGGNDETRFARYTAALAPDLIAFSPWKHEWLLREFADRASMTDYLVAHGFPAEFTRFTNYSVDGNLGGYAHDSDELERLTTPPQVVAPILTRWPHDAQDTPETFRVRFVEGRPVEINGIAVSAPQSVLLANEIGGRNGVCMRSLVENRVNGTKCRGVYEAPGLEVLGQSLAALYQVSLDKEASNLMHALSRSLGRAVYEGRMLDAASRATQRASDLLASTATGTVCLELYKGSVMVNELELDTEVPAAARQTRFSQGGNFWRVQADGPVAQLAPAAG